jgi:hypothetical protein
MGLNTPFFIYQKSTNSYMSVFNQYGYSMGMSPKLKNDVETYRPKDNTVNANMVPKYY